MGRHCFRPPVRLAEESIDPVALYLSSPPLGLVWLPLESPIVRATGIEHFAVERGRPS